MDVVSSLPDEMWVRILEYLPVHDRLQWSQLQVEIMELGASMKDNFLLDKSVAFTNHGSFGPVPKCVFEERMKYHYEQESQPDVWFRMKHLKYYEDSLRAAAQFLGGKPENMALVDNVTTGINTIVKSLSFQPGDKVLINSHTYDAVVNVAKEQEDFGGLDVVTVKIPDVLKSEDDVVELFRQEYEKHKTIKLHIIDHISSGSAIVFPVKKLVNLAKEHGALSLIDGAHAPGQVDLNLEDIDADFYAGNFHKWCYVTRSCGFLWFAPRHAGKIRPLVTSHGYKHNLTEQFNFCGTRDLSCIFTIPRALKFYEDVGGLKAIQAHADELLTYGCKIVAESLGTDVMDVPNHMRAPYMRLVRLPIDKPAVLARADEWTKELALLYNVQGCFTVVSGKYWIRLSCNIYNEKYDYVRLRDALVEFMKVVEL